MLRRDPKVGEITVRAAPLTSLLALIVFFTVLYGCDGAGSPIEREDRTETLEDHLLEQCYPNASPRTSLL